MRLFITTNMELRIKNEIESQILKLNKYYKGKWVAKDNIHLTMLFLGEIPKDKLDLLKQHLKRSVNNIEPFELKIEGIGSFSSINKTNILWAGVKGDLAKLNIIYNQLIHEMNKMNLSIDIHSNFHPHVTLARKIDKANPNEDITFMTSTWQVNSLELYQSIFTGNGVKYQRISSEKFTKGKSM